MSKVIADKKSEMAAKLCMMPTAAGQPMPLAPEDFPLYLMHVSHFVNKYNPANEGESNLVQRIADYEWRIDRIARLEMGIYAVGRTEFADLFLDQEPEVRSVLIEAHTHLTHSKYFRNLSAEESRLRNYVEKDMAELSRIQAIRRSKQADLDSAKRSIAATAPSDGILGLSNTSRSKSTIRETQLQMLKEVKPTRH